MYPGARCRGKQQRHKSRGAAAVAIAAHTTNDAGTGNVVNVWTGVPDTTSVEAVLKLSSAPAGTYYLAVSTNSALPAGSCSYFGPFTTTADVTSTYAAGVVLRLTATGLSPNTTYTYALRVDGTVYTGNKGTFKTPASGAMSFGFGLASCAGNRTEVQSLLAKVSARSPLFFMALGDWPYIDTVTGTDDDFSKKRDDFQGFTNTFQKQVPVEYIFSDHDYGATDQDGSYTFRNVSLANVRKRAPMRGMRSATVTDDIGHSFVVGRVRFICCDTRSNKVPKTFSDSTADVTKTMLGTAQKAWWKAQIDAAAAAGQVVVWAVDAAYHGQASPTLESWQGYGRERNELSNYLKTKGMGKSVCVIAGDAHMLAHAASSDNATVIGATLPVCQAAPIYGNGSSNGGATYTVGPIPAGATAVQQYGYMDVTDTGTGSVGFAFQGLAYTFGTDTEAAAFSTQSFTLTVPPGAAAATPEPRQATHAYGAGLGISASGTRDLLLATAPVAGNLLLLFCTVDKRGSFTVPSGFTLVQGNAATGPNSAAALYQKISDGTEQQIQITVTQGASAGSGDVAVYTEWEGKTVIDQSAISSPNTATTTNTVTSAATTTADETAVVFWTIETEGSATSAPTWDNGFTRIVDLRDNTLSGLGPSATSAAVATKALSATGVVSTTATHAATGDETTQILVTLKA